VLYEGRDRFFCHRIQGPRFGVLDPLQRDLGFSTFFHAMARAPVRARAALELFVRCPFLFLSSSVYGGRKTEAQNAENPQLSRRVYGSGAVLELREMYTATVTVVK
jgi:hypothetical protein